MANSTKKEALLHTAFKCPETLRQRLDEMAMRDERPLSQIIKRCIDEGIDKVDSAIGERA